MIENLWNKLFNRQKDGKLSKQGVSNPQAAFRPLHPDVLSSYQEYRTSGKGKPLCFAPSKTLKFSFHGNVIACGWNRGHILGKYPDQSIHDIWFGRKAEELRSHVANNDLSRGCSTCQVYFDSFNYAGVKALHFEYLADTNQDSKYPSRIEFELENTCNLQCKMCLGEYSSAIRKHRDKKPILAQPYGDEFVEELTEFIPHLKEGMFLGGEPFLIRSYFQIWEEFLKLNSTAKLHVQTNGTVLNGKIKDLMNSLDFRMSLSLDSVNPQNLEAVRQGIKYDQFMRNLEYFAAYNKEKNEPLMINTVLSVYNWRDLPMMLQFCNERDFHIYVCVVFYPYSASLNFLSVSELEEVSAYLSSHAPIEADNEIQKKNNRAYIDMIDHVNYFIRDAMERQEQEQELGMNYDLMLSRFREKVFDYFKRYAEHSPEIDAEKETDRSIARIEKLLDHLQHQVPRVEALRRVMAFKTDMLISEIQFKEDEYLMEYVDGVFV